MLPTPHLELSTLGEAGTRATDTHAAAMALPTFALSQGCSTFLRPHHSASRSKLSHHARPLQTPTLPRFYAAHATFARPRGAVSQPRRDAYVPRDREPFKPVPGATYYTECGNCTAVYEIDPDDLGPSGRKVQCSVCDNTWFQRADRLRVVPETHQLVDYPMMEKNERIRKQREKRSDRRAGGGAPRRRGSNYSVFVGNLPFDSSEDALSELVSGTATVLNVTIVKDRETGRSKGFGFVNVPSEKDVQTVVNTLDGILFNGRNLTMREGNRN